MLDLSRPIECTTPLEVKLLAELMEARRQISRLKSPPPKPPPKFRPPTLQPSPDLPPEPPPEPVVNPKPDRPRSAFAASVREIQEAVAHRFGMPVEEMLANRRQQRLVTARHVAVLLCYILTPHSYPFLSRFFGGRDHSTLLHSVRVMRPVHEVLIEELNNAHALESWVDLAYRKVMAPRGPNPVETVVNISAERASYATNGSV